MAKIPGAEEETFIAPLRMGGTANGYWFDVSTGESCAYDFDRHQAGEIDWKLVSDDVTRAAHGWWVKGGPDSFAARMGRLEMRRLCGELI